MALQFKCNILGIKNIFLLNIILRRIPCKNGRQTAAWNSAPWSNSACRSKKCNQKYDNCKGFYLTGMNLGICRALSPIVMHNKFWKYYMKDDSWGVEWTKYRQKLYLKCKEIDLERTYDVKRYQKYMQFSNWIQFLFYLWNQLLTTI